VLAGESELTFPDYPGNNMFATLGNLFDDGRCALLFPALGKAEACRSSVGRRSRCIRRMAMI